MFIFGDSYRWRCSLPLLYYQRAEFVLIYSQVDGRVLIDFHGFAKHSLGLQRVEKASEDGDAPKSGEGAYIRPLSREEQEANKSAMLKRKSDLIFLSPMLSGFAMGEKVWRTSSCINIRVLSQLLMPRQYNSMLMISGLSDGMTKPMSTWYTRKGRRTLS